MQHALTRHAVEARGLGRLPGYPLYDVDYVPGTVMLVRRNLFDEIGLLDEQFFFSGEAADFCKSARDRGYRVCVDLAVEAHHRFGETSLRDTLYVYYSLRNRLLYAKKHYGFKRGRYLARWLGLCSAELGKAIAQGRLGKARAILLAVTHGCTNQFGNRNAAFL
jgi:GT2 family glycosyltransferase